MTPQDLLAAIELAEANGRDKLYLTVDRQPAGYKIRALGQLAEVLCVNYEGRTVALFDVQKTRRFVERALKGAH